MIDMTNQDTKIEGNASLQSAAELEKAMFYQWMSKRIDYLADLAVDYELILADELDLDDRFFDMDADLQEHMAANLKEYDILIDFQEAVGALTSIKEKLGDINGER
jgi:hypothetical protein